MSASISTKRKSIGMDFLKKTAGYITGATGSYISDTMPVTTSTLSEAKNTISEISAYTNTSIIPKLRQLKTQTSFKGIVNWFTDKEESYSNSFESDIAMGFDIDTDPVEIGESQITEIGKNANQISEAVVSSSHKMVEAQLAATANLINTSEKQTAVITAGFDRTNDTLNKILEVLTHNTSALIEATVASGSEKSPNDSMVGNKFNLSDYKKMVSNNFQNTEYGMLASLLPAMLGDPNMMKSLVDPQSIVKMMIDAGLKKAAPNFKNNMKALDDAISDTLMTSLIRLGENKNKFGIKGDLARIFGIDSSRKNVDTSRSTLELKTVPFDSIAHEALTNAIPGYLRKILVAVGGEDSVYDYRSRSFKSKGAIHKEFREAAANRGTIYSASSKVKNAIGMDDFSSMVYDLMMTELGSRTDNGSARGTVDKLSDKAEAEKYIRSLFSNMKLGKREKEMLRQVSSNVSMAASGTGAIDILNQVAKTNINRNSRVKSYVDNANDYNVDLSEIRDSMRYDMDTILEENGIVPKQKKGKKSTSAKVANSPNTNLQGLNYTNMALYEIYRRLNEGINVFQVGSNNSRGEPFKKLGDDYLQKPHSYRAKPIADLRGGSSVTGTILSGPSTHSDEENLLRNQGMEDGSTENLSGGQRFVRWGKKRGGDLSRAIFSGSPEQVRDAFTVMIREAGQAAGDGIKHGAAKINDSSGNVLGYLKHKITGAGYKTRDDDGNEVEIAKNEKGGFLGYFDELIFGEGGAKGLAKRTSSMGSKWFKSVSSYFDYGDKDNDSKGGPAKRKQIIGASVGAMMGAGILGGPIGLIMGGIAGNAISQSDGIGDKIHKILFGDKEHEGDKKKDRNKRRGLIGRAVDNIVDPIRFQIGKTMTAFSTVLKKNILGPLSNIGAAIKERMANAAGGVVSKVFGGIFKGATGILKKLIMLPLNIAKAPINMLGFGARGAAEVGGTIVGGGLNSIAKSIAGKNGKSVINERIKSQKKDVTVDKAQSGFYGEYELDDEGNVVLDSKGRPKKLSRKKSYKAWKEREEKRRDGMRSVDDYTSERVLTKEEKEAAEAAKKTEENTSEIADVQKKLTDAVTGEIIPGSSFKSHDTGVHERLDHIIQFITGEKFSHKNSGGIKSTGSPSDDGVAKITDAINDISVNNERDEFSSSAVAAAGALVVSGDDVSDNESRLFSGIINESGKNKSNKQTISDKLKDLMNVQKKKSKEGEPKQSILDKIYSVLGGKDGILGKIGAVAAGIGGVLGISDIKSFYNDVVKGDMDFSQWWGEESKIGAAVRGIMDVSKFVGKAGGTVVNKISSGIHFLTEKIPFLPEIEPPQIDTSGPFAGLSTAILGGLYLKGASAIGSMASTVATLISNGSSALGNLGGGKFGTALKIGSVALAGYSYLKGPELHENTDAAGNEIVDEDKTRAMRMPGTRVVANSAIRGISNYAQGAAGRAATRSLGNAGIKATVNSAGGVTFREGAKFASNAAIEGATGMSRKATTDSILHAVTSSADDVATSKGAMGFVKKAIEGMKNFLMKNKTFSKFAKVIASKFDDILVTLGKNADKLISKMPKKIAAIITKGSTKEAASVATAGIGYAVMAFGGALSGGLSAANIFGVREDDVNGTMRTIASVVVAMLNAVPGLWALEIADLFIAPLTIRGCVCSLLYSLLGGGEDLEDKRETFAEDLSIYNSQYGAELSTDEYNDLTNKGMFAKIFGKGAVKTDENGRAMFDDAGNALRTNHGIAGWFSGGESEYAKDANGAVIKGADGKAIQAIDAEGHKIKKNMRWTDHVGNWFHDVGGFFAGKTTYETDENGRAIVDPLTGEYKVKEKTGNVFQRGAAAVSGWWNGDAELDENGDPILDENGNPVKKGGFKDWAAAGLGKFNNTAGNIIRGIAAPAKDWLLGEYERDENGNPLLDDEGNPIRKGGLAGFVKSGLGKVNTAFVQPAKEMAKGALDWVKNKADWVQDKAESAGAWISSKAADTWNTITRPVKDIAESASDWLNEKADWVKDKAKSVKDWAGQKVGTIFGSISSNISELADGAETWFKEKSEWAKDGIKDVKDWIGEKASSVWDWVTGGIEKIADRGEQAKIDEAYINSNRNKTSKMANAALSIGGGDEDTGLLPGVKDIRDINGINPESVGDNNVSLSDGNTKLPSPFVGDTFKVTSDYGWRTINGEQNYHSGIDLVPNSTDGKIGAVAPGVVTRVQRNVSGFKEGSYGNFVEYETSDGTKVMNAHMKEGSIPVNIKSGSSISPGDVIGTMGNTGNSYGPHLHFQVENSKYSKDPKGKYTTDPAPLLGLSTVSDTGKYSAVDGYSGVSSSTDTGSANKKSGIAYVLDMLKSAGTKFLNFITGGLYSLESADADSTISSAGDTYTYTSASGSTVRISGAGAHSAAAQLDPDIEIELLNNSDVNSISGFGGEAEVLDLKTGISYMVSLGGKPGGTHTDYTPLTPDDTEKKRTAATADGGSWPSWTPRPCILKIAGRQLAVGTHNYPHGSHIGKGNPGPSMPNNENSKPAGQSWPIGGHFCMYFKNSVSNANGLSKNAKQHQEAAAEAYNLAISMIEERKRAEEAAKNVQDGNQASLWAYLKSKGMSDTAVAGILGCWEAESANSARRIEADNLPGFPGYDNLVNDRQAMNDYTKNVVWAKTKGVKQSPYYGKDNNLYPGLGYAQWTGPRGQALLEYAKATGKDWSAPATQLEFMSNELNDSYYGPTNLNVLGKMSKANNAESAANIWAKLYEGNSSGADSSRINHARSVYNRYAGSIPDQTSATDGPVGGGDINIPSTTNYTNDSSIGSMNYKSRNLRIGGGEHVSSLNIPSSSNGNSFKVPINKSSNTYDHSDVISRSSTASGTDGIINLLYEVINELKNISTNTGSSSDLLGALNEKDFVDKGLRESIGSLSKSSKKNYSRHVPTNSSNVRTVTAMARP